MQVFLEKLNCHFFPNQSLGLQFSKEALASRSWIVQQLIQIILPPCPFHLLTF